MKRLDIQRCTALDFPACNAPPLQVQDQPNILALMADTFTSTGVLLSLSAVFGFVRHVRSVLNTFFGLSSRHKRTTGCVTFTAVSTRDVAVWFRGWKPTRPAGHSNTPQVASVPQVRNMCQGANSGHLTVKIPSRLVFHVHIQIQL